MSRLSVANISAGYGRSRILHDVSLPKVGGGELLGLLGPNASGKSSLIRCISGELPSTGEIALDGMARAARSGAEWTRLVATMPQTPPAPTALLPAELMWSTARALALAMSDAALAARIEELFADLGLASDALRPLAVLSGGKRQLVGLALALIRDPAVLLLDEPTSALDLRWRLIVLDLVRAHVRDTGGVAVVALHDLDLAARYCDRIALLKQGRVAAAGATPEVLTEAMLAEVYGVEARVRKGADGRPDIKVLRPLDSRPDDRGA